MKIFKEREKGGVFLYVNHPTDYFPDFLSGTTSKIVRYGDGYYQIILDHFKKNLESSNTLITIGYGFSDPRINEFIQRSFLMTDNKKTLFVVDVRKPDMPFLSDDNTFFVGGGVSQMDAEFILKQMNP